MFSAILEKVERLERENAELKSRLDQLGKDTADRIDKLERGSDVDRLGHHVCVGTYRQNSCPVFKNTLDFLIFDPDHPEYKIMDLLKYFDGEVTSWYVDSLKFFPIFAELGLEIWYMYMGQDKTLYINGKCIQNPVYFVSKSHGHQVNAYQTTINDCELRKNPSFDLFRETCLKYGVQLLFNGKPID